VIKFYRKNIMDITQTLPSITVTDAVATNNGSSFTDFLRNRDNNSGWGTTGSTDAANTTLEFEFNDLKEFDSIIMVGHNFKDFTLEYWSGAAWVNLETVADNTLTTSYFSYDSLIETTAIRLIIQGAMTVDADKFMRQFVVTEKIGTFEIEPKVEVEINREKKRSRFLSGKSFISTQVGGVTMKMSQDGVFRESDLSLIEELYNSFQGFIVSVSGGTTSQFETLRIGYRPQDIYFMKLSNEYEPNWGEGRWKNGINITLSFAEVN